MRVTSRREELVARNAAMRAELAEMMEGLDRQQQGLIGLQERLAGLSATATSSDETVTVTVDGRGQLSGLELAPYATRQWEPKALAGRILATTREAVEKVTAQAAELVGPALPAGLSFEQAMRGELDPTQLLPEAMSELRGEKG